MRLISIRAYAVLPNIFAFHSLGLLSELEWFSFRSHEIQKARLILVPGGNHQRIARNFAAHFAVK